MQLSISSYQVRPLREDFVQRARLQGLDDLNQPVEHHIAQGGEPCRDALRRARPGERLILASYCPLDLPGPYREYGPVFLLADPEAQAKGAARLPLEGELPYLRENFVLRAYSAEQRIVAAEIVSPTQAESTLQDLLARADVDFVLARFAAYGCYACRIERA